MGFTEHPKVSIVTPVFNGAKFVERTIKSVLAQTYPNIQYILIDGGSTDGTMEIINQYRSKIDKVISEPDEGMYDAIGKGFELADGEILSWINSDDLYYPHTVDVVVKTMINAEYINWVTGVPTIINSEDQILNVESPKIYPSWMIRKGYFRHDCLGSIQQESTFFSRGLYQKSKINRGYRLAGDFELWYSFAEHSKLYTIKTILASFRKHPGQLSKNVTEYINECNGIVKKPGNKVSRALLKAYIVLSRTQMVKPTDFLL